MIDAPFESNTTVAEEHFSSKNTYTFCCQSASINSHERVVKQQNKLKSLKKQFYQKYLSKVSKYLKKQQRILSKELQTLKTVANGRKDSRKNKIGLFLTVHFLSAIIETNKQTNKQIIYYFNDIQAPDLPMKTTYIRTLYTMWEDDS